MRCLVVFAGLLAVCAAQRYAWNDVTPLDEYVNRVDGNTRLESNGTWLGDGCKVYIYNLTSQGWMVDEDYTNRPVWWHHLTIAIPKDPTNFETAYLNITGGDNGHAVGSHQYICDFANKTGAVAALIQQVPNQPLQFLQPLPSEDKIEDAIIARTWSDYIASESIKSDVILNLPMTKAGKVAMDKVISEVNRIDSRFHIDKYIPTGESKRGWVAWLLACVDHRVIATAPTVISILNRHENLHHHYMAYGGWTFPFGPYWNEDISYNIDHPRLAKIFDVIGIDPLVYNPRLTMPKLLSMATGDEFFRPDDTHFFWKKLSLPKYMTLYENTGHAINGVSQRRDLEANILSFFLAVTTTGSILPNISWTLHQNQSHGWTNVSTGDHTPKRTQSWWADTPALSCTNYGSETEICRRDFRRMYFDFHLSHIKWEIGEPVEELGGNKYRVVYGQRANKRYRGFFVQMKFDGVDDDHSLNFTTEINVLPEEYPFKSCNATGDPDTCKGVLK